ncbi:hypothetical protein HIM_06117 [Hirsutella minnesotensis 3608]|uniref:Survival protein SurE-like phosphatase/nucleotidase domain-containing protein n=1 Tax=Hirsutella minnesotensis 3608 TaxID=1043627 RepID=A0A0F7ZJL6_9HYPO|nr:hypothetical protein HIM_06117 [Hirsutella minnesotensis 3608]
MKSLSSLSMAASAALLSLLSTPAHGLRILQSNDDGWAEHKLRALNDAYIAAGHDVILSAPAEDKSATGQTDMPPMPRRVPCHWNSCLSNSGPAGFNATRPELNWVNSGGAAAGRSWARLDGDRCNETSKFHWFFTRINPPTFSPRDTWWCNHNRLPMEFYVMKRDDCPVSVTVTDPWGMSTINDNRQEVVLSKLRHMLTCP